MQQRSLGRGNEYSRCTCVVQVWTYRGRVAFVLSVTEKGRPVWDGIKLQRLKQLVTDIMTGDGEVIVDISKVCGAQCRLPSLQNSFWATCA